MSVVPELQAITADVKPAILVLLAAVALLLITATANVASLQLARATVRRREMAVRAAIGAGQRRIVRQLLIESAIVGLCGGAAGLALAAGFQRVLPWLLPDGFPRLDAVALDLRALSFALAVSVLASVACGLLPAWHTRRVNLVETLSEDGVASISGAIRSPLARTRALIMVGQVAIACVLLVGARCSRAVSLPWSTRIAATTRSTCSPPDCPSRQGFPPSGAVSCWRHSSNVSARCLA